MNMLLNSAAWSLAARLGLTRFAESEKDGDLAVSDQRPPAVTRL
ncbi:MAG: hypothetical protein WA192_00290 [Candidatus Acidiferrales bacterium]